MKHSIFFKKIFLLGLFAIPAAGNLAAQNQDGRQNGATVFADWDFKNSTGQAVNGICIELPEGNKISVFKTGANRNTLEVMADNSNPVSTWSCFKFKVPVNNNTIIQSEIEKNDKRNIEKKMIRFFWMNNGVQVGPEQKINFFAYGTLKYG